MTARDAPVLVRTRRLVDGAHGPRLILPAVDVDELLRLATATGGGVDLDAVTGAPAPDPGPARPAAQPARDAPGTVTLAYTRGDAARLARAAWEVQSDHPRYAEFGSWAELGEERRSLLVSFAARAIDLLVRDAARHPNSA